MKNDHGLCIAYVKSFGHGEWNEHGLSISFGNGHVS